MNARLQILLLTVLVASCHVTNAEETKIEPVATSTVHAQEFIGCWKADGDKPFFFRCEPTRVSWYDPDRNQLQAFRATYGTGIFINVMGRKIPLPVTLKNGVLVFAGKTGEKKLRKIDQVPDELTFTPLQLGKTREVPAMELKVIQEELAKRFKEDQRVRPDPNVQGNWEKVDDKDMHKVDADNTAYLLTMVSQYGWIDVARFGSDASLSAWFIVQHSGHLPLMLAVLPETRKELVKRKTAKVGIGEVNVAESYAMLYDRVQVMLGNKQRYGSQMGQNEKGKTLILALEDPKRVDEFRAEIGLDPILPGLKLMKQQNPKQAIEIEDE